MPNLIGTKGSKSLPEPGVSNGPAPDVPLTTNATNWMKKPYVKGMYPNPGTLLPWKFVYIERDPAKWDTNVENIMKESDPKTDAQLAELTSTQKTAAK